MRNCKYCLVEKNLFEFVKAKKCKDGYSYICKSCSKTRHINVGFSSSKEYRKEASLKYRKNNYENNLFLSTRSRANLKGIDFNLEPSDILIPEYCPYLNVPLTKEVGVGKTHFNASLDRIDNNKGYIKGNIMIISDLANTMKRNASIEQLICFAENVLRIHLNNKPTR